MQASVGWAAPGKKWQACNCHTDNLTKEAAVEIFLEKKDLIKRCDRPGDSGRYSNMSGITTCYARDHISVRLTTRVRSHAWTECCLSACVSS